MNDQNKNLGGALSRCAAIVCAHVATAECPILIADRSEPEDPADSGWQFLCGTKDENWNEAKVWSVGEVVESDPSLASLVNLPIGTRLVRVSAKAPWEEVPAESERQ
jgi:hypothetical protein